MEKIIDGYALMVLGLLSLIVLGAVSAPWWAYLIPIGVLVWAFFIFLPLCVVTIREIIGDKDDPA